MRIQLFFILIGLGLNLFSQEDTTPKINNIIKITPLKIADLSNPSIEITYERRTGEKFSTQVMVSYLLPTTFIDKNRIPPQSNKGFRAAIEEKYYFNKVAPLGLYSGIELDFLSNDYDDVWNFGVEDIYSDISGLNTNYTDTFSIKKQTLSLNLKLGYQIMVKRIFIDFYAGIGLRHKDVKHYHRINPNDAMERPRHPNFYYYKNMEGKYWTISMPLNIRIGYTF